MGLLLSVLFEQYCDVGLFRVATMEHESVTEPDRLVGGQADGFMARPDGVLTTPTGSDGPTLRVSGGVGVTENSFAGDVAVAVEISGEVHPGFGGGRLPKVGRNGAVGADDFQIFRQGNA